MAVMWSLVLIWMTAFGAEPPPSAPAAPFTIGAVSAIQDFEPAGPSRTILPLSGPVAENPADVVESWGREAEYGRFLVVETGGAAASGHRLYLAFRAFGSEPEVAFLIGEATGWRQLGDDGVTVLFNSGWIHAGPDDQRPTAVVGLRIDRTADLSAPASITVTPMRSRTGE